MSLGNENFSLWIKSIFLNPLLRKQDLFHFASEVNESLDVCTGNKRKNTFYSEIIRRYSKSYFNISFNELKSDDLLEFVLLIWDINI